MRICLKKKIKEKFKNMREERTKFLGDEQSKEIEKEFFYKQ